ncbi:unnamed protein product [Ectocarpus sp. 8 AP-2014]
MLGMLLPEDENFLWIAEESLLAPLPEGWSDRRCYLYTRATAIG